MEFCAVLVAGKGEAFAYLTSAKLEGRSTVMAPP
jgi:hypothetical protein